MIGPQECTIKNAMQHTFGSLNIVGNYQKPLSQKQHEIAAGNLRLFFLRRNSNRLSHLIDGSLVLDRKYLSWFSMKSPYLVVFIRAHVARITNDCVLVGRRRE